MPHGVAIDLPVDATFTDQPDTKYDYRVRVRLHGVGDPRPRITVAELTVIARDDGPPITVRGLHSDAIGRILSSARHGLAPVTGVLPPQRRPQPRRVDDAEIRLAATAYKKAQRDGRPTGEYVRAELSSSLRSVSKSVARNRIMRARMEGLLPPCDGTTRPRLDLE